MRMVDSCQKWKKNMDKKKGEACGDSEKDNFGPGQRVDGW